MPDLPLPNLTPLNSTPALFIMGLGYVMLLMSVVYLTNQRASYVERERAELLKLLQNCLDKKVPVGAKSRILTPKTELSTGLRGNLEPFSLK